MTDALPPVAGVGLKAEHYDAVFSGNAAVGWFEVHPENYMGAGGLPHHALHRIRQDYPLSLHGVGLSLGGAAALDRGHLQRLKRLIERYQPASFSEHLAWSSHDGMFMNDLLPLPYTEETVSLVCTHIDETQDYLGRRLLLENPSRYVEFRAGQIAETVFLAEVARRTGCGLLLDVNNVFVSCSNSGTDPRAYIDAFPLPHVAEIHLAGHACAADAAGSPLLIDTHDRAVIEPVWQLYAYTIARCGRKPTLIEWDAEIPAWPVLQREASLADAVLATAGTTASLEPAHAMA